MWTKRGKMGRRQSPLCRSAPRSSSPPQELRTNKTRSRLAERQIDWADLFGEPSRRLFLIAELVEIAPRDFGGVVGYALAIERLRRVLSGLAECALDFGGWNLLERAAASVAGDALLPLRVDFGFL